MYNVQEQEEYDYRAGLYANDAQTAFAHSQSTYRYASVPAAEIDAIVAEGKFAVVGEMMASCPLTDAILPQPNRYLRGTFETREAAQAYAVALYNDSFGEEHGVIYPKLPVPMIEISDSDIPF